MRDIECIMYVTCTYFYIRFRNARLTCYLIINLSVKQINYNSTI